MSELNEELYYAFLENLLQMMSCGHHGKKKPHNAYVPVHGNAFGGKKEIGQVPQVFMVHGFKKMHNLPGKFLNQPLGPVQSWVVSTSKKLPSKK